MDWEVRIIRHKPLLYIELMDYKVLLYSPGDYMQYPVRNHNGKGYFKEKKVKVKVTQSCPTKKDELSRYSPPKNWAIKPMSSLPTRRIIIWNSLCYLEF